MSIGKDDVLLIVDTELGDGWCEAAKLTKKKNAMNDQPEWIEPIVARGYVPESYLKFIPSILTDSPQSLSIGSLNDITDDSSSMIFSYQQQTPLTSHSSQNYSKSNFSQQNQNSSTSMRASDMSTQATNRNVKTISQKT